MAVLTQARVQHSTAFRLRKLRGQVLFWFVLSLFIIFACFPVYWLFLTTFKQVNDLYNLQNNPLLFQLSLALDPPTFTIPFCTWLLMGFFTNVPREITEAARVDGCSRLGAMFRIVLPLSVPGILTICIFAFTLAMQEYVYALTFVSSSDQKMITLGVVTDLIRGDVFFWG